MKTNNLYNIRLIAALIIFMAASMGDFSAFGVLRKPVPTDTTIGFNALDYVLQKPLGARQFPDSIRGFGKHFFITAEMGPQWINQPNSFLHYNGPTPLAGLTVGSWFTPVHGLRMTFGVGYHDTFNGVHLATGRVGLDYMMNLTSLLSGYDPSRPFEVIATAGGEAMMQYRQGKRNLVLGGRLGMQLRWNMTPSTFMYLEPRFGVYTDNIDRYHTWQRYDRYAALMFGFGYRMVPSWMRHKSAFGYQNESWRQGIFYGFGGLAGASINGGTYRHPRENVGIGGNAFIGKRFSAVSSLRLNFMGSTAGRTQKTNQRNGVLIADLAYQLNINSLLNGYDPRRAVELNFLVGPSLAVPNHHRQNIYPGIGAGLQGVVNIDENWGLFLEPYLRIYGREFAWNAAHRVNAFANLSLGVRYMISTYRSPLTRKYNYDANREDWLRGNDFFISVAAGLSSRGFSVTDLVDYSRSPAGSIYLGKWFSPASAWRLGLNTNYRDVKRRYMDLTASLDYMLNLSALSMGWNERRVLDLSLIAGVEAGDAYYYGRNKIIAGAHGGVQARFNLSRTIGLYVEPQFGLKRLPGWKSRNINAESRVLLGLVYKLGGSPDRSASPISPLRSYVSVAGGSSMASETTILHRLFRFGAAFDASVGCWLAPFNALQVGIEAEMVPMRKGHISVGTLHADYLLDLVQVMNPDRSRRFGVIPHVGAGVAFSDVKNSGLGWSLRGGVRLNWRVTDRLDLFVDPTITVWQPKIERTSFNSRHFAGTGKMYLGAAWRF